MTGLILAAGLGERLNKENKNTLCKPLQEVNGVPLLYYSLSLLERSGIEKAVIVVGKYYEQIRKKVGDSFGPMKIEYEVQKEQKGLVNAIVCGCRNCEDDVTVLLADELFVNAKLSECLETFSGKGIDFISTYTVENDPVKIMANFSFRIDESGKPYDFVEKPTEVINKMKGTGVSVFSSKSIEKLKRNYNEEKNVPNTLCDFFNMLLEEKMSGEVFEFADTEVNVNTLEDLEQARSLFKTEG